MTFELKILDEDLRKDGFWRFRSNEAIKFLNIINKKYNLGFTIKKEKSTDNQDLSWMN